MWSYQCDITLGSQAWLGWPCSKVVKTNGKIVYCHKNNIIINYQMNVCHQVKTFNLMTCAALQHNTRFGQPRWKYLQIVCFMFVWGESSCQDLLPLLGQRCDVVSRCWGLSAPNQVCYPSACHVPGAKSKDLPHKERVRCHDKWTVTLAATSEVMRWWYLTFKSKPLLLV